MKNYNDILNFWFAPENIKKQFEVDENFDNQIREQFLDVWESATKGLLVSWRKDIKGRLAEIIVLDQFSRNLFRNSSLSYSQDKMALILAQEIVNHSDFEKLTPDEQQFALMPFMHSESIELHNWAEQYFNKYGKEDTIEFEKRHYMILKKFGRYPTRNNLLSRENTKEEKDLLDNLTGSIWFAFEIEKK